MTGITQIQTQEGNLYLNSIPVYYTSEQGKAILPEEMAIAFPMDKGRLNRVSSLSTIYTKNGDVYIQKGVLDKQVDNAFLYNGGDLYFFVDRTTVTVNENEYILSPLSYVNVTYKGYVEIYDYDTDTYERIEDTETDVIARTSKYTINMSNDTLQYEGIEQLLLKRIKNLPNME